MSTTKGCNGYSDGFMARGKFAATKKANYRRLMPRYWAASPEEQMTYGAILGRKILATFNKAIRYLKSMRFKIQWNPTITDLLLKIPHQ